MTHKPCAVQQKYLHRKDNKGHDVTKTEKPYHHGDLKNTLIASGMAILAETGLSGLTLRGIAARAGVSHTAPKNHFGSLAGLRAALAQEGFRMHAAAMRAGLDPDASRTAKLQAASRGYVQFALTHPQLFELMFSPTLTCDVDPVDGTESYAILAEISNGLIWDKATLAGGQQRTEMMLWSLVHGYAQLALAGQFITNDDGTPTFDITDIMPHFRYNSDT